MKKLGVILSIIIFLLALTAFGLHIYDRKTNTRDGLPAIYMGDMTMTASVGATDEELLTGVTASDAEDGDLTQSVIVENISRFIDTSAARAIITYAVADSDNNVAKASRIIEYADYHKPRFELLEQLSFPYGSAVDLLSVVRATDCLDGDLTGSVKVTVGDAALSYGSSGIYPIQYRVVNSKGDVSYLETFVEIYEHNADYYRRPVITFKSNVLYVQLGETLSEADYIDNIARITLNGQEFSPLAFGVGNINVFDMADTSTAGFYTVRITAESLQQPPGAARLVVVVDDGGNGGAVSDSNGG